MKRLLRIENMDTIKPFNCGDEVLNGFLLNDARFFYDEFIANTYVLEDDDETIAYFSILNDKVSSAMVPKNLWSVFRLLQNEIPEDADTVLMYFDLKAFTE